MNELTPYEKIPRLSPAEFLNENQMSIYDELEITQEERYPVRYSRSYVWLGVQPASLTEVRRELFYA